MDEFWGYALAIFITVGSILWAFVIRHIDWGLFFDRLFY
jgi:hypothetical protein